MNSNDSSFARFKARLEGGDDGASLIFQRFTGRLLALARSRLAPWVQAKVDPEDVLQSAYGTFFKRGGVHQREFGTWKELWGLLATITVRKCIKKVEYLRAGIRDARRDQSLEGEAAELDRRWEGIDPAPAPDEEVIFRELIEQLLGEFDAEDREIINLTLEGRSSEEISQQLGRAQRTVRRVRERFKKQLEDLQAEDD